ncbi:MAG TPA: dienelactone hydrolase family protein [Candidatus Eisenbacteria bacterium]|nr:dienelactone hydrolase family protein [Candidatus Eisenbacteria bacterium]
MRPHAGQPVETRGPRPEDARAAVIMIHGRNAMPQSILELVSLIGLKDIHYVAPAAENNTWYPYSFLTEIEKNEPGISSGYFVIDGLVNDLLARGLTRERILLLGFSQGGCLASTYAARRAARYGGVFALSGGLIGPPGTRWDFPGSFEGTPVFLGCSDVDGHIPKERVQESAEVFRRMQADVTMRLYSGMGHTVNNDEVIFIRQTLTGIA